MKRFLPSILFLIAVAGAYYYGHLPVQNPDPNHTHADFAVWVHGTKLDFSDPKYMSEAYEEGKEIRVDPLRKYLHLHDGNGEVLHRHKPGLTFSDFLGSLGLPMTGTCMTLDEFQYAKLDAGWKADFAVTPAICTNGKFHWTMVVNDKVVPVDPAYVPNDGDQILLSYSASDTAYQQEWKEMTDEACLYSRTCPWRGPAPTEHCIADPAVPCVAP